MKKNYLIIGIFLVSLVSCKEKKSYSTKMTFENKNLINILKDSTKQISLEEKNIQILSKRKDILTSSSLKDTSICKKWDISEQNLIFLLKNSIPITPRMALCIRCIPLYFKRRIGL